MITAQLDNQTRKRIPTKLKPDKRHNANNQYRSRADPSISHRQTTPLVLMPYQKSVTAGNECNLTYTFDCSTSSCPRHQYSQLIP